jgi:PST family polysaccharide transporter
MVVAIVVARLVAPHDWGVAGEVLAFSTLVYAFTGNALGTPLIQRRNLLEVDRSTVFWLNAGIGLLLMLAGIGLSGPLASFYHEPQVRSLFAALSVGFFVTSLGMTQTALLAREMRFRQLELRQIGATLVGAVLGITIALAHKGAWALVCQQLAEALTSTVLLWCVTPWRPSLVFSRESMRRLGGFAGYVFGENVLYQAGRTLSPVLIGRFLGAAAVGAYVFAGNVILMPFSRIAAPIQQVFLPAFSRMNDDRERVADVWIRASRLVGAISIPALVGLVVVAPDFVHVVLGSRWAGAIVIIQILAWAGLIQSVQTLSGEVLLALNRAVTLFRFTVLWFVANLVAFVIGLHWGIVGVATCYVAATAIVEPVRTYLTSRALGISVWRFIRAFGGVTQATALMAATMLATRAALIHAGLPAATQLGVLVVVGGSVYIIGCLWRAPEITYEVRRVIRGRGREVTPRVKTVEGGL